MQTIIGRSYHIKDQFFTLVNDPWLMQNKDNGKYRPHFLFVSDPSNHDIYWAIPQSSKVQKYQKIISDKIKKYGKCDTIIIANFGGSSNAFLLQNMFPIINKYIDHEHTINGQPVTIHQKTISNITTQALKVLNLHKQGIKVIYPYVDRIYNLMLSELAT